MSREFEVRQDDRLRAAVFLQEALGSDVNPIELESELVVLKIDEFTRTYTVEVDSTVGAAAFLIYQYQLDATSSAGKTGHDVFRADLETLEVAAERDTPGPRILAHATAGNEAYILATTPATYRALTGQGQLDEITASEDELLLGPEAGRVRSQSADDLLKLLKEANDQAKRWFGAVRAEGRSANAADTVEFSREESALALFLIDQSSIQDLLRMISVMVAAVQQSGEEPDSFNPGN